MGGAFTQKLSLSLVSIPEDNIDVSHIEIQGFGNYRNPQGPVCPNSRCFEQPQLGARDVDAFSTGDKANDKELFG